MKTNPITEYFSQNKLPTKQQEAWKFISNEDFVTTPWNLSLDKSLLSHDQLKEISRGLGSEFCHLVLVDGVINNTLSDLEQEFFITSPNSDKIEPYVDNSLEKLNLFFNKEKVSINFSEKRQLDKPLMITLVSSEADLQLNQNFLEINLGSRSRADIIVLNKSLSVIKKQAGNYDVSLNVASNANLNYYFIQAENKQSTHFSRHKINIENHAAVNFYDLALGGKNNRHYMQTKFHGSNAYAGLYGLTILDNDQHTDHYTFIDHLIGGNQSVQHYKSIVAGQATSVFRGRIRIEAQAQKANSEQLNNNLLLSRKATAHSIPQLEIYADDVKAGHGSTLGQLSEDEVFYFLSRGISMNKAIEMLTAGFCLEILEKIENPQIQFFIKKQIEEKLANVVISSEGEVPSNKALQ